MRRFVVTVGVWLSLLAVGPVAARAAGDDVDVGPAGGEAGAREQAAPANVRPGPELAPAPLDRAPPAFRLASGSSDRLGFGWRDEVRFRLRTDRMVALGILGVGGTLRAVAWLGSGFRWPFATEVLVGMSCVSMPAAGGLILAAGLRPALAGPVDDAALRPRLRGAGVVLLIAGSSLLAVAVPAAVVATILASPTMIGPVMALPLTVLTVGGTLLRYADPPRGKPLVAVGPGGLWVRW